MISRSESREASVFTFRKNPPKKNHLFPTQAGVGLANGRAGTEHPGF